MLAPACLAALDPKAFAHYHSERTFERLNIQTALQHDQLSNFARTLQTLEAFNRWIWCHASRWTCRKTRRSPTGTSSSLIPMTSAWILNSPTRSKGSGSSTRKSEPSWSPVSSRGSSAPARTSTCWAHRRMRSKSTFASSPTRRAAPSKMTRAIQAGATLGDLNGRRRGVDTNRIACDEIYLVDDGNSAVSLPKCPCWASCPGTGGLTRLVDKRKVPS